MDHQRALMSEIKESVFRVFLKTAVRLEMALSL
jgi:hypothetical protein